MLFISADGVFRLQDLGLQPLHVAVQPQHRRLPDGDVQIARLAIDDRLQQFVDKDRGHLLHSSRRRCAAGDPAEEASSAACSAITVACICPRRLFANFRSQRIPIPHVRRQFMPSGKQSPLAE